ncbi:MAG: phosphoglycerate mutase family protein, partial [Eubacteriales bacterium]|nr:phosphoglycerate mutase family protein [Eubacteriales bacterium]
MKIILIRHGKTAGNIKGRYIGKTDEPLCEEGINEIRENT